jgi:hypothetical protein
MIVIEKSVKALIESLSKSINKANQEQQSIDAGMVDGHFCLIGRRLGQLLMHECYLWKVPLHGEVSKM